MTDDYLNVLDGLLTTGVSYLSSAFREAQIEFVLSTMQPDGGFRGRQGGSDLYYTDFALRALSTCGYDLEKLQATADFVTDKLKSPKDVVECFNGLNAIRTLSFTDLKIDFEREPILKRLEAQKLISGGFSRLAGKNISAYNTFLAKLCYDMLEEDFPCRRLAIESVRTLKRTDGGFSEMPNETSSQTSSTAAVITLLLITDELTVRDTQDIANFLRDMQPIGGGLLPCSGAPEEDLLSTFTGLSCLFLADAMNKLDLAAIARMAKLALDKSGGFKACPSDSMADVEYTFYGLGILALLNLYRESAKNCNS
ncbi:MAG: hypothetical protein NT018_06595 [Armatimonadetes bacterium]|nr:hypothetical protein [Armatimonadota bacterium]